MPGKNKTRKVEFGNNYYISTNGRHTNKGTEDSPWSLAYAMKRGQPGDTLWLCGGKYTGKRGMNISVSGTADRKITIKPCPGDNVRLDGAIPEFTTIGNNAWEPYKILGTDRNVYRSVKCYPISESYGGFIEIAGKLYSLAPHKVHSYLFSRTQEWTALKERYLGPGIAQDKTVGSPDYKHLFIRLDNSTAEAQLDRPVPQITDPDPRHHAIYIGSKTSVGINISGSHLVIEDFSQINHFGKCITLSKPNQTDITLRNCGGRPIYFGVRCGSTDGLLLDSCTFRAHMPSETWWVSYADIKVSKDEHGNTSPGEPVANQVRKAALDLGDANRVKVSNCTFEEFFDGILANAPHHVEVDHCLFKDTWDDAWQMNGKVHHVDFHHNFCYGAGPSLTGYGLNAANRFRGTIYIHHNVIDTTTNLLFWVRFKAPGQGIFESIPLSSHVGDTTDQTDPIKYTLPRKIYYNTIVTGRTFDKGHPYVGWSLFGAMIPNVKSEATHEVYNNIFLVIDGRPGGRDFDAISGWEIYDGNVYWHYQKASPSKYKSPWRFLNTSSGTIDGNQGTLITVTQLRDSQACEDSKTYYPPGWEYSGLSENPKLDRRDYRPREAKCLTGAVNLTQTCWPWTSDYEPSRGAVPVSPVRGHKRDSDRAPKGRRGRH